MSESVCAINDGERAKNPFGHWGFDRAELVPPLDASGGLTSSKVLKTLPIKLSM